MLQLLVCCVLQSKVTHLSSGTASEAELKDAMLGLEEQYKILTLDPELRQTFIASSLGKGLCMQHLVRSAAGIVRVPLAVLKSMLAAKSTQTVAGVLAQSLFLSSKLLSRTSSVCKNP